MFSHRRVVAFLIFSVGLWGCTTVSSIPTEIGPSKKDMSLSHVRLHDLAGVWEYKENNAVYPLTFDQKGNGTYEWKNGRFITTSLEHGLWKGTWHQQENDREGGFEIHLDQDLRSATGRWWYTRIERDSDPLDPGGTFTLNKVSERNQR